MEIDRLQDVTAEVKDVNPGFAPNLRLRDQAVYRNLQNDSRRLSCFVQRQFFTNFVG